MLFGTPLSTMELYSLGYIIYKQYWKRFENISCSLETLDI